MTSPAPLSFDTYYHIYNRGNNGENIFIQERNYDHFLNLLFKYIEPITQIFAYCLLRNHFHLLVRIKSEQEIIESLKASGKPLGSELKINTVSNRFSDLFNAYAKAIKKIYTRTGSLFEHPFGRVPITTDSQFWSVIAYIHQNPQKHKFVNDFRDWKWSSYGIIPGEKPTRLQRDIVLDWFGGKLGYWDLHQEWVSAAHSRWFAKDDFD